ncbi:AraC family transcriptional regulator [Lacrimispora indolis]|uniref:AraC family transcriptional regulator n=1 Tax=Lacrimispora indolis TaxID=69825 RepID=UPI000414B59A|nr:MULTISPECIES: AraC family transcriptional regulator [Lachnospiraceae]MBE7722855.1 helix-turn-helix domain-containing protein [Lacrimispora celerecrescens]
MAKQRERVEFRYYGIPETESVLALLGEDWIREYGKEIKYLHFHDLMEIGYCHWGDGEVMLGQEQVPFSGHSIMIVPPRLPHTTNSVEGTKGYWEWIYIDMEKTVCEVYGYDPMLQRTILKRLHRTGYLLPGDENPALSILVLGIMEEVRHKKPYYKESIRGYLYAFMAELLRLSDDEERIRKGRSRDAVLTGALDYVAAHYAKEIKINDLAEACSMSESHFRRVFEEGMNMKPLDYVNLVRVQNACELLKKTDKSMEEVGAESGFASISAFNRNFRKLLDISPYQWKKSEENYEGKLLNYKISAQRGWD